MFENHALLAHERNLELAENYDGVRWIEIPAEDHIEVRNLIYQGYLYLTMGPDNCRVLRIDREDE